MNKYLRITLFGFISWLVPFVAAFFFYSKEGKLNVDVFLFKSIMIVTGAITVSILLISIFRTINSNFLKEGIIIGSAWFIINIGLDFLILLPMSGMPILTYFTQIGLSYLVIPAMCITTGATSANVKKVD